MAFDQRPGAGALYRLDLDGTVTTVLDGLTVSNGMGWSPDDRTVYLADSGPGLVWPSTTTWAPARSRGSGCCSTSPTRTAWPTG